MNVNTEKGVGLRSISRNDLATQLEAVAFAHILFPVTIVTVAVAAFAVGWRLNPWYLPLSAVLTVLGVRAFSSSWRITLVTAAVAVVTYVGASAIASAFFDLSYDGQSYHQEAVLRLAQGWNPLFENAGKYGKLWHLGVVEYFPKASWIAGAVVFSWGGHIEAGKLFHLTFMVAAWCQVAAALLRLTALRFFSVALLAFLAAANPVAVYQSITYLVDGLLASMLTIVIAALTTYMGTLRWQSFVTALIAVAFAINVKFTGLVYSVILLGFGLPTLWLHHGRRAGIRMAAIAGAAVIVSTFLLGYAPYARNLLQQGELFYPLWGPQKEAIERIMEENIPANLAGKDRFSRFMIAHFTRTQRSEGKVSSHLKFPLSVSKNDIKAFRHYAIQVGGFGPFFGELLTVGTIAAVLLLAKGSPRTKFALIWLWSVALLVSIFVHYLGWWPRYAPQAWLLPLFVATAALLTTVHSLQWLGRGIVALALVNVLFVAGSFAYKQREIILMTKRCLLEMAAAKQPVHVYLENFQSWRQRLREAGIQFILIEEPSPQALDAQIHHTIPGYGNLYWQEETSSKRP